MTSWVAGSVRRKPAADKTQGYIYWASLGLFHRGFIFMCLSIRINKDSWALWVAGLQAQVVYFLIGLVRPGVGGRTRFPTAAAGALSQ